MARLHSLPVQEWDEEFRELVQPDLAPPVQPTILGIYANAPDLAKPFFAFRCGNVSGLHAAAALIGVGTAADRISQPMPQLYGDAL